MQTIKQKNDANTEKQQNPIVFAAFFIVGIVIVSVAFNIFVDGKFLEFANIGTIISNMIWPTFVAWGFCFLFACDYTDLSIGGILVLGSFATTIFGSWYGYPGVILGGLVVGTLLVFINFNIFAFSKIPSWIAGISIAMIYEAAAFSLKVDSTTSELIYANMPDHLRTLGKLPWSLIILAVFCVLAYIVYNKTTIGLNIRALGGNVAVSKSLGINVRNTLLLLGIICGIFIGIAAVVQQSYASRTTVATGLTSIYVAFKSLAIALLAQILQKQINIIIAVPICAVIIFAVFNMLTILNIPSGTLQEACLGIFLIVFGSIGQRGVKGVVK